VRGLSAPSTLRIRSRQQQHPSPSALNCFPDRIEMQTQLVSRAGSRVAAVRVQRKAPVFAAQRPIQRRAVAARAWDDDEGGELPPLNQWPDPDFTASVLEAFPEQGLGERLGAPAAAVVSSGDRRAVGVL
jgi:hypothetical protein